MHRAPDNRQNVDRDRIVLAESRENVCIPIEYKRRGRIEQEEVLRLLNGLFAQRFEEQPPRDQGMFQENLPMQSLAIERLSKRGHQFIPGKTAHPFENVSKMNGRKCGPRLGEASGVKNKGYLG